MSVINFRCPHCSTDLKVRDDQIAATPVNCPDCRQPIVLARDEFGHVTATSPAPAGGQGKTAKKPQKPGAASKASSQPAPAPIVREEPPKPAKASPIGERFSRTTWLAIAGSVVGLAVLAVAGIVYWPRRPNPIAESPTVAKGTSAPAAQQPSSKSGPAPAGAAGKTGTVPATAVESQPTVSSRLTALGRRIVEYRAKQGHYPSAAPAQNGQPPSERLSWLAQLVTTGLSPSAIVPAWNESWRSPQNDRFVRQRVPELLNPSINKLTGAENYPTTHFAGVAGVGSDAADLPVWHPRAGVFGNNRATRLQDIHDGASNTLMVVGVTGDLGSWAANGAPTVRAFTQEPYINGPDGIGTGSPDRMMVLKADGSVQELSAKTDPRIIRRMAAMSDGLSLDPRVPGEPGERSPQQPPTVPPTSLVKKDQPAAATPKVPPPGLKSATPAPSAPPAPLTAASPTAKKPVVAPVPAPKPDVTATLAQRVVHYEQIKPAPLRDVLNGLEELVTVPIRGDRREIPDIDEVLQTPITVQLDNTTVAAILEAILAPAKLTYQVQGDSIQLHRLGPASGPAAAP
jgi:predicted Zn finger-like uncharacterized protein